MDGELDSDQSRKRSRQNGNGRPGDDEQESNVGTSSVGSFGGQHQSSVSQPQQLAYGSQQIAFQPHLAQGAAQPGALGGMNANPQALSAYNMQLHQQRLNQYHAMSQLAQIHPSQLSTAQQQQLQQFIQQQQLQQYQLHQLRLHQMQMLQQQHQQQQLQMQQANSVQQGAAVRPQQLDGTIPQQPGPVLPNPHYQNGGHLPTSHGVLSPSNRPGAAAQPIGRVQGVAGVSQVPLSTTTVFPQSGISPQQLMRMPMGSQSFPGLQQPQSENESVDRQIHQRQHMSTMLPPHLFSQQGSVLEVTSTGGRSEPQPNAHSYSNVQSGTGQMINSAAGNPSPQHSQPLPNDLPHQFLAPSQASQLYAGHHFQNHQIPHQLQQAHQSQQMLHREFVSNTTGGQTGRQSLPGNTGIGTSVAGGASSSLGPGLRSNVGGLTSSTNAHSLPLATGPIHVPINTFKIPLPPWLQAIGEKRHSEKQLSSNQTELNKAKKKYRQSMCLYCARVYPQSPWATMRSRKYEHEIFKKHEKSTLHQRALVELNKSALAAAAAAAASTSGMADKNGVSGSNSAGDSAAQTSTSLPAHPAAVATNRLGLPVRLPVMLPLDQLVAMNAISSGVAPSSAAISEASTAALVAAVSASNALPFSIAPWQPTMLTVPNNPVGRVAGETSTAGLNRSGLAALPVVNPSPLSMPPIVTGRVAGEPEGMAFHSQNERSQSPNPYVGGTDPSAVRPNEEIHRDRGHNDSTFAMQKHGQHTQPAVQDQDSAPLAPLSFGQIDGSKEGTKDNFSSSGLDGSVHSAQLSDVFSSSQPESEIANVLVSFIERTKQSNTNPSYNQSTNQSGSMGHDLEDAIYQSQYDENDLDDAEDNSRDDNVDGDSGTE